MLITTSLLHSSHCFHPRSTCCLSIISIRHSIVWIIGWRYKPTKDTQLRGLAHICGLHLPLNTLKTSSYS
jgi:hypothetical protein